MCSLSIQLITSADISLRSSEGDCGYTLTESDWKQDESRAYNISRPIEVFARKDPFTTRPRLNTLGAKIEDFSQLKKVGQSPSDTYNNPWQGYSIPNILVSDKSKLHNYLGHQNSNGQQGSIPPEPMKHSSYFAKKSDNVLFGSSWEIFTFLQNVWWPLLVFNS